MKTKEQKRILSLLMMVLILMSTASMSFAYAETTEAEHVCADINNDHVCDDCGQSLGAVVSVEVVWTDMSFTFDEGDWNVAAHTYDDRGWKASENGGELTVTNNGNAPVSASFSYLANEEFTSIGVEFRVGEEAVTTQNIPINETINVTVQPMGEPNERFESAEIGTIAITITTNGEVVEND